VSSLEVLGAASAPGATVVVVERPPAASETRREAATRRAPSDRAFRGAARGSGAFVLILMTLIGVFLGARAQQALAADGWKFVTTEGWLPDSGKFGIAGVLTGSVLIAVTAIFFALPLAMGTALYISEFAPTRIRGLLVSTVDLMAAVPSIVFGLWGLLFFQNQSTHSTRWVAHYFGWIPFLHVDHADFKDPLATSSPFTGSTIVAGVIVALMVTPIACSVMRESFSQAPLGEREGAYALGATRWGMIRSVVLPFARGGVIGGTMLGLGRALGETIAVYMLVQTADYSMQFHILQKGASSVSALIALQYGASSQFSISALMAAGLALFLMTLVVNFVASMIVARSRSGAESEA
jgi:phosphate transport system permease protein